MMNGKIDLRSDTVTHPTPAKRQVMAHRAGRRRCDTRRPHPSMSCERKAACVTGKEAASVCRQRHDGTPACTGCPCEPGGTEVTSPRRTVISLYMKPVAGRFLARRAATRTLPAARGVRHAIPRMWNNCAQDTGRLAIHPGLRCDLQ
jgi:hypothetical protein